MFGMRKKRGEISMCKKIREVNALNTEEILKRFWDGKIPVNVKHILAGVGVRFREYDISALEQVLHIDQDDAILGMALSDGDELGILYSNRIDKDATNYVLAHEFGHCCLHLKPSEKFHIELKLSSDLYSKKPRRYLLAGYRDSYKEIQADKFAADLLIPTKALLEYLDNNPGTKPESIAKHFHVSEEIVRMKIVNMKRNKAGEMQ